MNWTRLSLIDGGLLVVGSGLLNSWVTYVKLNGHMRVPYPEALSIMTAIGWIILIPAAFIARKAGHQNNRMARIAVLSAAFASLAGSLRVGAVY